MKQDGGGVVVLGRQGYIRLHWFVGVFACMNAIQDGASNCWGRRNEHSILGIVWGVRRCMCTQSTIEKMFGLTKTMARVQLATLLKKYRMVDHKKQHNIKSIINSSNIKIINLTFLSIINSKKRLQCVDTSSPSPSPCRTKSKRARVSVFELKCWIDLLSSVLVPTI